MAAARCRRLVSVNHRHPASLSYDRAGTADDEEAKRLQKLKGKGKAIEEEEEEEVDDEEADEEDFEEVCYSKEAHCSLELMSGTFTWS